MARTNRFQPTDKQKADKKNRYPKSKTKERMKFKQRVNELAYS